MNTILPASYQDDAKLPFFRVMTEYMPRRYPVETINQLFSRSLILDFKEGGAQTSVVENVAKILRKRYRRNISSTIFVCMPASTEDKHKNRYACFSERVAMLAGCKDGYKYIKINNDIEEKHKTHFCKKRFREHFTIDESISGKKCIIFDDVITSGKTAKLFIDELRSKGAIVISAVFLGITIKPTNNGNKATA